MKRLINFSLFIAGVFLLQFCTKTESDFSAPPPETITVNASTLNVATGISVSFLVSSSINNTDVTPSSKIYVNGLLISGNSFTFTVAGNFAVYATKGALTSGVITINVTAAASIMGYKHRALVEEYSGTWCGNCPRILYGVDLLHQQTDKAIVVSTHLFNGDPFITTEGNNLAALLGVSGVPTGFINRTKSWTSPQYENVPQVINTIQASAPVGIAISSSLSSNNLSVTVRAGYAQPLIGGAKLTVYLVEDKLFHTQSNYSSNLYGGQSSIPNFRYDGVIRKVVSSIQGDVIGSSGILNEKTYALALPTNVSSISNARIVAFITNAAGSVVNVQQAKVGEEKAFEVL